MAALALMILVTATLATGATRWDFLDVFCFFHDFFAGLRFIRALWAEWEAELQVPALS